MSVISGAGDFKRRSGKLYFPFQLSGDTELNPFREVTDVGDGTLLDFAGITKALADKGGDDTIPVLDSLDVHRGALSIRGGKS